MVRNLIILIIILITNSFIFAQTDTSYYANKNIHAIIKTIDDEKLGKYIIDAWYPDGEKMASAICIKHKGNYRPVGYSVIFFENGKIFQEYKPKKNILLTYYEDGKIKTKLLLTEGKKTHKEKTYYKNGKLKEIEFKHDKERKLSIVFYLNSKNRSRMSQAESKAYYKMLKYHPNGKKMYQNLYVNNGEYKTYVETFYNEKGKLDTLTKNIEVKSNSYSKDRKKYGRWIEYYPSGKIYKINNYKADRNHGLRIMWYENGQIKDSINYNEGRREGEYKTWYEDGKLKKVCYYKKDMQDGPEITYHLNGQVERQGTYLNGSTVGIYSIYDSLGNLLFEVHSNTGRRMENSYNYRNGKTSTFTYKGDFNGIRDGVWKVYYPNGKIFYTANYKNGILDGTFKLMTDNGGKICEINFNDGYLNGKYIFYFENGNILYEGNYTNHKKTGIWTNYFENGKKYTIKDYDDEKPWNYAEWHTNGTPKLITKENTKHNKKEKHYYDKEGVLLYTYTLPYGRTNFYDLTEYYPNGNIYKMRTYPTDKNTENENKEFYENGELKYQVSTVKNKLSGISTQYYGNGNKKSEEAYVGGKRNGKCLYWNLDGSFKNTLFYKDGIEIIKPLPQNENNECTCNKIGEPIPANSFYNSLKSFCELDKINKHLYRFKLDTNFNHAFFRYDYPPSDKSLYGKVMSKNDLYVDVDEGGLRMSLTPCRNNSNIGDVFINYRYSYPTKTNGIGEYWIEIKVEDITIEFPKTILTQWDIKNNKPLTITNNKKSLSRALIPVSKLVYSNLPEGHIEVSKRDTACFTPSEITGTGIILTAKDVFPDLYSKSIAPKDRYYGVYNGMIYPAHEKYFFESNDLGIWISEPDDYLRNFMGIVISEGNLKILFDGKYINASTENLLIDANEINGFIKIARNKIPADLNENRLREYLSTLGLIVHNTQEANSKSNDDNIIIYFTFKADLKKK